MRALVKSKPEPGIWMERAARPRVGHNDLLIRVRKAAICGTDVHIYNWDDWSRATIPVPLTIGHEFVGEVVEIGGEVAGFAPGDRVSGEGHVTCGHCRNCRNDACLSEVAVGSVRTNVGRTGPRPVSPICGANQNRSVETSPTIS